MDMMISLPPREKDNVITLAPTAEWRLYRTAHLETANPAFPDLSLWLLPELTFAISSNKAHAPRITDRGPAPGVGG